MLDGQCLSSESCVDLLVSVDGLGGIHSTCDYNIFHQFHRELGVSQGSFCRCLNTMNYMYIGTTAGETLDMILKSSKNFY